MLTSCRLYFVRVVYRVLLVLAVLDALVYVGQRIPQTLGTMSLCRRPSTAPRGRPQLPDFTPTLRYDFIQLANAFRCELAFGIRDCVSSFMLSLNALVL